MKKIILLLCMTLMIASCASSISNLKRETALNIGNNTMSKDVEISNVKRGITSVSWSAATPSGNYECEADDMLRKVHCVKLENNKK